MKINQIGKKQSFNSFTDRQDRVRLSQIWKGCAMVVSETLSTELKNSVARQQMFEAHGKQIAQAMTTR